MGEQFVAKRISRLVVSNVRCRRTRTLQSVAAIQIETTMILVTVGIGHGMALHRHFLQAEVAVLVLVAFFLVTGVACAFGIMDRLTATLERERDISILKASRGLSKLLLEGVRSGDWADRTPWDHSGHSHDVCAEVGDSMASTELLDRRNCI